RIAAELDLLGLILAGLERKPDDTRRNAGCADHDLHGIAADQLAVARGDRQREGGGLDVLGVVIDKAIERAIVRAGKGEEERAGEDDGAQEEQQGAPALIALDNDRIIIMTERLPLDGYRR